MFGQHVGQRRLSATNITCNRYVHIFLKNKDYRIKIIVFVLSNYVR